MIDMGKPPFAFEILQKELNKHSHRITDLFEMDLTFPLPTTP